MKYWYDTEFIEDGYTIDLISIGIISEDGRELYLENSDCNLGRANDWVKDNVLPALFLSKKNKIDLCNDMTVVGNICGIIEKHVIADEVALFCDQDKYGKPELWGYYSAYDHVALCQLFGTMMDLPKGWPMYTRDIKQFCDAHGNPKLPEQGKGEHNALEDARWNKKAYEFLFDNYIKIKYMGKK